MLLVRAVAGIPSQTSWDLAHFPVGIGRAATAGIRLEKSGVWDQHAEVGFDPAEGFILSGKEGALTRLNGETVQRARIRNGDVIEVGSVKLQCWLSEVKRKNLAWREGFVWVLLIIVTLLQLILIGRLL